MCVHVCARVRERWVGVGGGGGVGIKGRDRGRVGRERFLHLSFPLVLCFIVRCEALRAS